MCSFYSISAPTSVEMFLRGLCALNRLSEGRATRRHRLVDEMLPPRRRHGWRHRRAAHTLNQLLVEMTASTATERHRHWQRTAPDVLDPALLRPVPVNARLGRPDMKGLKRVHAAASSLLTLWTWRRL